MPYLARQCVEVVGPARANDCQLRLPDLQDRSGEDGDQRSSSTLQVASSFPLPDVDRAGSIVACESERACAV